MITGIMMVNSNSKTFKLSLPSLIVVCVLLVNNKRSAQHIRKLENRLHNVKCITKFIK